MRKFSVYASTAALLIAAPLLTGCSTATAPAAESSTATADAPAGEQTVALVDGWAKAGEGMTGVFGTLTNPTDHDLVITAVESPAAAKVELHEVTSDGVMQKIQGDVIIPAGGAFELMPGGNHIMLMMMPEALLAGEEVEVTLTFDDGTSATVMALVKDYSGANESYEDIEGMEHGMDGHETGSDEHVAQ